MLKAGKYEVGPRELAWIATLIMVTSLPTSRALLSISTVLLVASAIWNLVIKGERRSKKAYILAGITSLLFILPALSFFWSQDIENWGKDVQSKLSYLVIPFAYASLPKFTKKQHGSIFFCFTFVFTALALISVGRYFLDFKQVNELIKDNSSILILGGLSHIYFGYMLAFAIIMNGHFFLNRTQFWSKNDPWIALLLAILGLICIHVLTSRTGLLAFYGGALSYLLMYIIRKRAYIVGAVGLLLLVLIPIASYHLVPSFYHRFYITLWDVQSYQKNDKSLKFQSVGLRLYTWETSLEIFADNPILGVGMGDVENELVKRYEAKGLNAPRPQWLTSTHNQYLEHLTGLGIVGLLSLFLVLLYPLVLIKWPPGPLIFAFIGLTASAMLPESILERQVGVAFFAIFLYLILSWERQQNKPG